MVSMGSTGSKIINIGWRLKQYIYNWTIESSNLMLALGIYYLAFRNCYFLSCYWYYTTFQINYLFLLLTLFDKTSPFNDICRPCVGRTGYFILLIDFFILYLWCNWQGLQLTSIFNLVMNCPGGIPVYHPARHMTWQFYASLVEWSSKR